MNDVLQPTTGYLPAWVNLHGYICTEFADVRHTGWDGDRFCGRMVVHKETRLLYKHPACCYTYSQVKPWVYLGEPPQENSLPIAVELTPEGAGRAIFVARNNHGEVLERLLKWRGCYGLWDTHAI